MEYLWRVWHTRREHLPFRAPGSFFLTYAHIVEIKFPSVTWFFRLLTSKITRYFLDFAAYIYVAIHFTLFSTAYIVYIVFSCCTCHLYVGKIYTNVLFVFCIKVPSATWHFTTGTFSHICVICFLHKGAICHMALYNTEIFSFLCSAERCHLHNCKYLINYQVLIIDPTIYDKDWCEVHLSKKA